MMRRIMPPCAHCQSDAKEACSACFTVFYCSKACQVAAWPAHKGDGPGSCAPAVVRTYNRESGDTPLHCCVMVEALESLGHMLTLGINPDVRSRKGLTGLMVAASEAKLGAMACLLDGGAAVDATHIAEGVPFSALTFALRFARHYPVQGVPAVALLIERGAKHTVADRAMAMGSPELLGLLQAPKRAGK
jgi:hypothetical protein